MVEAGVHRGGGADHEAGQGDQLLRSGKHHTPHLTIVAINHPLLYYQHLVGPGAAFCNPEVVAALHCRASVFIPEMLLQKNSGYSGLKSQYVTLSEGSCTNGPVNVGLGKKWKGEPIGLSS